MPKTSKNSDDEIEFRPKREFESQRGTSGKKEGKNDLYKCGDAACGKFYHSYTAFYNHCKKSHSGQFPQNSIHNGKLFEGPSKNRGRPRIKKNQTKDQTQIQTMKRQNELIEFLGTLKTKKAEELIVHVENPIERLDNAVAVVEDWLGQNDELTEAKDQFCRGLRGFNRMVAQNDLPEFYDPIESANYKDNLDSYNFSSIHSFMTSPDKRLKFDIMYEGTTLLNKVLLIWLTRILSQKLLSEVIYSFIQFQFESPVKQKQLLVGRTDKLKELANRFFQCFMIEPQEPQHA